MSDESSIESRSSGKKNAGHHCIAPGCTNYYYKNSVVSYHRLPVSDKLRLKKWLHVLKRKTIPKAKFSRVCSEHFMDCDFVEKGFFNEDGSFQMKRSKDLKPSACPSVFNFANYDLQKTDRPCSSKSQRSDARKQRHNARRNKKVRFYL